MSVVICVWYNALPLTASHLSPKPRFESLSEKVASDLGLSLTASCLSPLPRFESLPEQVRKLPGTLTASCLSPLPRFESLPEKVASDLGLSLTASCLSPLPRFESLPEQVRKLPVTWGSVVVFPATTVLYIPLTTVHWPVMI